MKHDAEQQLRNALQEVQAAKTQLEEMNRRQLACTRRFIDTFTNAAIGMAYTDLSGRFIQSNRAYQVLTGYSDEELCQRTSISITHPGDRERQFASRCDLLAGRIPGYIIEKCYIRKDGSIIWVRNSVSLLKDTEGQPKYLLAITEDITERKKTLETFADNDRKKDEFLAMLAHELRNPLAPIRSSIELLKRKDANAETRDRAVGVIERQTEQMIRLVDELLDVSRVTQGKILLKKSPTLLSDIIQRALETIGPVIDARAHALEVTLPEEPVVLDADLIRLAQVIANILHNAAKYTPADGRIELRVESGAATVTIHIRDNGIGMEQEELSHVFEMFNQADSSRALGGLGLGLTLARTLTALHGGTVAALSGGAGQGSEFLVTLPTIVKPVSTLQAILPPASAVDGKAGSRRVLVVDDNIDGAETMRILLELSGHEVLVAYDGDDAVRMAKRCKPDVVLCDIGLPGISGHEVARQIRQLPNGRDMILIAVTGYGQERDRAKSSAAGFDYHFVKPMDFNLLAPILADTGHSG